MYDIVFLVVMPSPIALIVLDMHYEIKKYDSIEHIVLRRGTRTG